MKRITSAKNARVKAAVRLREGRHRQRKGRFLIDGARELARALEAGIELAEVFVCPALSTGQQCRRVLDGLTTTDAVRLEVTEEVFARLAFGERTDGVLAVAVTPVRTLDEITLPEVPLIGVLEGVEKPGNVGAVLRSADGAGLDAVVVADPRTDLYNPNTIRASLGTVFTMAVVSAGTSETLDWLRCHRLAVYAARVDGAVPYTAVDFRRPAAIVFGSEAEGLSSAWKGDEVTAVRLPMLGAADSLNVSAAAAILFYEARRQRESCSL